MTSWGVFVAPKTINPTSEIYRIDFLFVTDFYCLYDICIRLIAFYCLMRSYQRFYLFLPFLYSPFSNRSFKAVVVHADLYQSLALCRIRNKIALVVNLLQGSVGRTIVFQLHHVYGVWQVQHGICSAYSATFLHLDIGSHKIEDEIEHGLEVALVLFLISCISIALWF